MLLQNLPNMGVMNLKAQSKGYGLVACIMTGIGKIVLCRFVVDSSQPKCNQISIY